MTDLCFESDAETQCEAAIQQSLVVSPDNLDALQAYASFRLSQSRPTEACELIESVYIKTQPLRQHVNNRTVLEELSENESYMPVGKCNNKLSSYYYYYSYKF